MRIMVIVMLLAGLPGCIFVKVPLQPEMTAVEEQVLSGEGRAKIALLDLSGIISHNRLGLDRFSRKPPLLARFKEELEAAESDPKVVGVVVRIDSPGGSVTASDILYHELRQFSRRRQIPVVACIMDKGVSGGYYAALGSDEIFAHPTSVVGGVGVIFFKVTLAQMLQKWGVEIDAVKSGEKKDFWSPLRTTRPEELHHLQTIVDRLQDRFLGILQQRRNLTAAALEEVDSGIIFDVSRALELGLIDRIGYLQDAVERAKAMANVSRARVVVYRRPGAHAGSIYAGSPWLSLPLAEAISEEFAAPGFRYQVRP